LSYRTLLVGLGAIGMGYDLGHPDASRQSTHARAMRAHTAFGPLVAVDPDAGKRRAFDAEFGGPSFATLREALANAAPDVVIVAAPTDLHRATLEEVLGRSRPQAILCEKPLAHALADAEAMVSECERHGVQLFVNYMRRADPGVRAVREMIESGEIGTPLKAVVWYSKGVVHNGSHFVDLMRYWLGPVRTASVVKRGRQWQGHDPEPDFLLEHQRGTAHFLAAAEENFSHYTVEMIAGNGRLRYENGGDRIEWQRVVDDADFPGYRILAKEPRSLPADTARSQGHVAEQLRLALGGARSELCTGREGLQTLRDVHRVARDT
jgi:predicted dehydrogenase